MIISEVVGKLLALKAVHGDVEVRIRTSEGEEERAGAVEYVADGFPGPYILITFG